MRLEICQRLGPRHSLPIWCCRQGPWPADECCRALVVAEGDWKSENSDARRADMAMVERDRSIGNSRARLSRALPDKSISENEIARIVISVNGTKKGTCASLPALAEMIAYLRLPAPRGSLPCRRGSYFSARVDRILLWLRNSRWKTSVGGVLLSEDAT